MRGTWTWLTALGSLGTLAGPAAAYPQAWIVRPSHEIHEPEYAGDVTYNGYTCGMAAVNDPSGIAEQDPIRAFGHLSGGPFSVTYPATPAPAIFMTCSVQVNANDPNAGNCAAVSGQGSGSVTVSGNFSCTIGPLDNVYVCTEVTWIGPFGFNSYAYDEDHDHKNGWQCALAISLG